MYAYVVEDSPIPASLFHPYWFFDRLAVLGPTLADPYASDRYAAYRLQRVKESALAVLEKLRTLLLGMKESFASTFAKGIESLLTQQDKKLASWEQFPLSLPELLVEETPLQYRKRKRRAMTGLRVAEERERDASRQRQQKEREAAALEAADIQVEAQEEARILEAEWVADTQLELQLS